MFTVECEADTCLYEGTCEDLVNGYKCHCVQGFSGVNCEITPDFCSGKDCHGGRCISSLDKFTGICLCNAPWYEDTGKVHKVLQTSKGLNQNMIYPEHDESPYLCSK